MGNDAETAVAIVHQPIAGMPRERRNFIGKHDIEVLLHLQRQYVVRKAHVVAGDTGNGRRDRPVFVRKLGMRYPPMVTAVAGQYCIAGMRVHHPFWRTHDTSLVGEVNFNRTFQFSCLDMFGIARDLGGIPALPAAAKYQLIASFVILRGWNHTRQENRVTL